MTNSLKTVKLYRDVDRVHNELRELGLGSGPLKAAQVAPFDQYHYGGTDAVSAAVGLCGFTAGMRVLDVGSGLGGPARHLATSAGLRVKAVELQGDLHEEAAALTARCGLAGLVEHVQGDILSDATPVGAGFDGLVSWQAFLHIADRPRLLARCFRALRPGGRAYVEDYAARAPLTARERALLHAQLACAGLPSAAEYAAQMACAGFTCVAVDDLTEQSRVLVRERLDRFRAQKARHVRVHGHAVVDALDEFYAACVELFNGGNIVGIRIKAHKPEEKYGHM